MARKRYHEELVADESDDDVILPVVAAALTTAVAHHRRRRRRRRRSNRRDTVARVRTRKTIEAIYREIGDSEFRRAYRMSYANFQQLCRLLDPHLNNLSTGDGPLRRGGANGKVSNSVRVAVALRYFAGGKRYDLNPLFGLSPASIYKSIEMVVEAINRCPEFEMKYPTTEDEQWEIARGFREKSDAQFDCCAGAIDGILIWTHMPSLNECKLVKQGQTKFFCDRKKKYGLNMQAVCDSEGRFLDVSIQYGGASSDLVAFEASVLHGKLVKNLLAEGLCIFGDNAYPCASFMATPYSGKELVGAKDNYNFFHSQLRISIECAFGRLLSRWGFLQMKAPQQFSISKIIATVICLCRLHNFCTNCSIATREKLDPSKHTDEDRKHIRENNGVPLVRATIDRGGKAFTYPRFDQLMDGGDYNESSVRNGVNRAPPNELQAVVPLPRERLCAQVVVLGKVRPPIRKDKKKKK